MIKSFSAGSICRLAMVASAAALAVSCTDPTPQHAAPPVMQPSQVNRFQVVVASEGDRGTVLFLVDSQDGSTWIYRPPQGTAINGFWSDIPRITYPPDFWQRAFAELMQPQQQQPAIDLPPPTGFQQLPRTPQVPSP